MKDIFLVNPENNMSVAKMVFTILDRLQHVDQSIDWRGKTNWKKLGSDFHCWRCGGEFGKDLEMGSHAWHHIIPSSEGGSETFDNRSLLCGNCHNVVHRFYVPTDRIGKKRTREGKWRRVVKFEESGEIFHNISAVGGSLASCPECESLGIVVYVSEGYWDGEGMMVFLNCSECDHRFAVPFVGARNTLQTDPYQLLYAEMEIGFAKSAEGLPKDLSDRVKAFGNSLISAMRESMRELKMATRIAQLKGTSEKEHKQQTMQIRQKYVEMIMRLLPEAEALESASKKYSRE